MERLLTLYSEVQSTDVRWLWYPFIAIGKITLLQGDPGDGKIDYDDESDCRTFKLVVRLRMAVRSVHRKKVIYQCSEDGVSDTIKPRLETLRSRL